MIKNRIKKFLLKIAEKKQIKEIRDSKYFNEEYYLETYKDVKNSGMDAATHYYQYGYKEGRNPSANFSPVDISSIFHSVEGQSPYLQKTASEVINSYFDWSLPLNAIPVDTSKKRINIIFTGFDKGCFFGGKATALMLAIKFCQKYKYTLRIIAQNPDKEIFYKFLDLFHLTFNYEVEFYSIDSDSFLEIGNEDHFICTMWVNADKVLNTKIIHGKVFYIMQEVETFFYDHGDNHLRCYNTLTSESLIPIVNSRLLYDYLSKNGYNNIRKGICFEPSFPHFLFSPSENSFRKKEKHKLFFYARPAHQRNLFYFGLDVLNKAFLTGVLDSNEWEVYLAGDTTIPNFKFDTDVKTNMLGVMSWKEYCEFISDVDLCYSMIYTPHTSYPPFDTASSGAVVVTNKYQNKGSLQAYCKNILSAELNEEDMLLKLKEGSDLSKDIKTRKENYELSNIKSDWDDSFKDVLPFMEKKIAEITNE